MFKDKETDFEEMAKPAGILNRDHLNPSREMRWTKLVDSAERSLYWLIPAVTLAYIVFRILPLLSS
jgi:hypothetical protein